MGKRFQSRPPSRAVRLGLSAVLAIGLMPWGGVAVAAEGGGRIGGRRCVFIRECFRFLWMDVDPLFV